MAVAGCSVDLEKIADVFVDHSLAFASENPSLDSFYKLLFEIVSMETGLSEESVKYVHHAFHWGLFLDDNSPLSLVKPRKVDEIISVSLKPDVDLQNNGVYRDKILEDYGPYIRERLESVLSNSRANS